MNSIRDNTQQNCASMKALPKRKGNVGVLIGVLILYLCLNESPSKKEGKFELSHTAANHILRLNESPSKKEGKFGD